ncbi:MAG: hypothetical protein Q7T92_06275 [Lutibacter sp.]|nr:hypothetical protein [Lutibacter sp.]
MSGGKAEIITEDLRLFERLFYQLKNVFKKMQQGQKETKNEM